jgi:hypothetical protein
MTYEAVEFAAMTTRLRTQLQEDIAEDLERIF